mmetsp:Transcript_13637/g.39283  ORF Transcript_13637/g.39283 Transcript_13637/m.39283 type:complete len:202 (-) Transcript_13637:166-771(-)
MQEPRQNQMAHEPGPHQMARRRHVPVRGPRPISMGLAAPYGESSTSEVNILSDGGSVAPRGSTRRWERGGVGGLFSDNEDGSVAEFSAGRSCSDEGNGLSGVVVVGTHGIVKLIIQNLPCRMTREDVCQLLDDSGLGGTYLLVDLPSWTSRGRFSNKGYAFVDCLAVAVPIYKAALQGRCVSDASAKRLDIALAATQTRTF